MSAFRFDPVGTRIRLDAEQAHIQLAQIAAGVKFLSGLAVKPGTRVANGRVALVADPKSKPDDWKVQSKPNPYCTIEDLNQRYGRANIADWSNSKPTPEQERKRDEAIAAEKVKTDALIAELCKVRRHFYPDFDIADIEDGPPEYVAAVNLAIQQHFPPSMTLTKLETELDEYNTKLFYLMNGRMTRDDCIEMLHRISYFDFWFTHLNVPDAPVAPDPANITAHQIQTYFKMLRDVLHRTKTPRVETPPVADGPLPPKSLVYKGKTVEMEPTPWKLLNLLWPMPRRVKVATAEQQVWGDESESDARLKSAMTKANKAMLDAGCPLSLKKSGEWLTLE